MAQETINLGTVADDGTGDGLRAAGQKVNNNFTELYAADAALDSRIDTLEAAPVPYDIGGFAAGTTASSELLLRTVLTRAITIPVNFAGSVAKSRTVPGSASTFVVRHNGVQIGSFTFAAGQTTAGWTSTFASPLAVAAGDIIEIVGPTTVDTLSDTVFTIKAAG